MNIRFEKYGKTRRRNAKPVLSLIILSFSSLSVFAQQQATQPEPPSALSNPLLIALLGIASVLLIVIIVFADMVKAAAAYKCEKDKKSKNTTSSIVKTIFLLFSIGSVSTTLLAQTGASTSTVMEPAHSSYWGLDSFTFYFMVGLIATEIFIAWMFYDISMQLLGVKERKQKEVEAKAKAMVAQPSFLEKLNASVAIEEEADIMLDHNYDGIRELDNNLPPWWKYGFYLTILFAFIYLIHFHVLHTGKLQLAEYEDQLTQAKTDIEEYRKKASNLVDETNATLLTDNESLASGRSIYIENCAPCHGKSGEGNVGPNLTDDYWLHKGGIKDIFRTIKFGWPEKGMKSWQQDLGAKQIHEVASYIKSLHGTHPANAKELQGELYAEESKSDSSKIVQNDSIQNADRK